MNTQIEKMSKNARLSSLLMINEITRQESESFNFGLSKFEIDLMKIKTYLKVNENWNLDEVHILLTEEKLKFKNKYEFFEKLTRYKETQIKLFLRVAKLDDKIKDAYKAKCEKLKICPSLEALDKEIREAKKEKTNTSATAPKSTTTTEKPKKVVTEAKHVEAKINVGADRNEVIELVKKLMADYSILPSELKTKNTRKAKAA